MGIFKFFKNLKTMLSLNYIKTRPAMLKATHEEFLSLLRQKKYKEIVEKYNELVYIDKFNPYLYFYYMAADNNIKDKFSLINNLYYNQPKRSFIWNAILISIIIGTIFVIFSVNLN
jgi:hypothetical protein